MVLGAALRLPSERPKRSRGGPRALPMPTLSSLIVQREVATMRKVEDAIARQVLHGGDLETNILEISGIREDLLIAIVAESFGLGAAPSGRLPAPPPAVLRTIPSELALRHGIFPLDQEG